MNSQNYERQIRHRDYLECHRLEVEGENGHNLTMAINEKKIKDIQKYYFKQKTFIRAEVIMSNVQKIKKNLKFPINKQIVYQSSALLFWYLAMFPGRVGYDTKITFEMMRKGENTDWWTAVYFRLLQILTFNGQIVFLFSAVMLIMLAFSTRFLIFNFGINRNISEKVLTTFFATPIFGVFGMTVAHDVLQVSGIFIVIGVSLRILKNNKNLQFREILILLLGIFLSLTVKSGIVSLLFFVFFLLTFKKIKLAFFLLIFALGINLVFSLGMNNSMTDNGKYIPILMDFKCIAQHPEARITQAQWSYLTTILPESDWKKPFSCQEISGVPVLNAVNYVSLKPTSKMLRNYLQVIASNPAIFAMAHIQRSSAALPPPFFKGPDNQVDLDYRNPIGEGVNIALQKGPELLHPSVDYEPVKISSKFLKTLNYIGQIPTFFINQASWFWGWGGALVMAYNMFLDF